MNRRNKQAVSNKGDDSSGDRTLSSGTVTRRGRPVNKPARFRVMNSLGTVRRKEGEVVRSRDDYRGKMESGERAESEVAPKTPG